MKPLHLTVLLFGVLAITGGGEREADQAGGDRAGEVVVYATVADADYLQHLFAVWSDVSGVRVNVRHGTAPRIVDEVIGNSVNPPADLLWSAGVAGVWRAADEGALRPVATEGVARNVPGWLRDGDAFWVATGYTTAVIVQAAVRPEPTPPGSFADLADSRYAGRLCLSGAALAHNRAVIAGLIQDLGLRPAEIVVRGWLANLARPVFATEDAMIEAVAAGYCAAGIATEAAVRRLSAANDRLRFHTPDDARIVIDAVGVGRHARNPQAAIALLSWLTDAAAQAALAEASRLMSAAGFAASNGTAARWPAADVLRPAWLAEDCGLLAERAGYR